MTTTSDPDAGRSLTYNSDFYGIVLNAAVAAMDGCPWVEKGRVLQVADGIAETVADRIGQVDSFLLPDGRRYVAGSCVGSKRITCPCGLKERPGSCGWCEE